MLLVCFALFPLSLSVDNAEYWDETNAAMHSSQFVHVGLNDTYWRHQRNTLGGPANFNTLFKSLNIAQIKCLGQK